MYRAFLPNSPSKRTIHRWYSAFKSGRENLNDDPRAGRPCTTQNIRIIQQSIEIEPKQSLRQLAKDIGISKDTVRAILIQQLDKHKVCSVWVGHTFSLKHKYERVLCAKSIVKLVDGYFLDDLMKFWVTEDETWQLSDFYQARKHGLVRKTRKEA